MITPSRPIPVCDALGCTGVGDHTTMVGYHLCRGHWRLYAKGAYPRLKPGALDAALARQQAQYNRLNPPDQSNPNSELIEE